MQYIITASYKRLFAFILDLILIVPLITVVVLFTNKVLQLPVTPLFSLYGFEIAMDNWAHAHFWDVVLLYSLLKLLVLGLYYIPFEASSWQGTPGKRLMKIKVTDLKSHRISVKQSTIRFFSKILSAQFLIGYVMVFFTKNKQGLHDLIAKTIVQDRHRSATGVVDI